MQRQYFMESWLICLTRSPCHNPKPPSMVVGLDGTIHRAGENMEQCNSRIMMFFPLSFALPTKNKKDGCHEVWLVDRTPT